jgi:hypothetical protein
VREKNSCGRAGEGNEVRGSEGKDVREGGKGKRCMMKGEIEKR